MDATRTGPRDEVDATPLPAGSGSVQYILRLYVTGKAPNSLRAIAKIREVCEECLLGRYQLQVVDMYQQPALAGGDHIMVTPTLVRRAPGPLRKLIGNLADRDRILAGLELQPAAGAL
jgi:circadian clock protein KaiB